MRGFLFLKRKKQDAELQQEMEMHLEIAIAENVERGMNPREARREAYLKFGNVQRVRETLWQQNSVGWVEKLLQDLRYVLRRLKRAPVAVLTVMVSLGLGIAANVVVFSGVNKLVFQGPPVGEPARLMSVVSTDGHGKILLNAVETPVFEGIRTQAKSFSGVAGYTTFVQGTLAAQDGPERVWGQSATVNLFDVAEVPMAVGRGFSADEENTPVMVLGYGLWQHAFQGDKAVVGKSVILSGKPFTVIGVARQGFRGILPVINSDFWVPLNEQAELQKTTNRNGEFLNVVARLQPGVSVAQGQAEMTTVAQRLAGVFSKAWGISGLRIQKAGTQSPELLAQMMALIAGVMVIATLVLCIAGSNVANLLLARAMARHREMAVRIALGATRWQLIRPMLLESVLLSLGGGIFGVGVSLLAVRALLVFHLPVEVPFDLALSVDGRVLTYAFLLSVGVGLLCGIGPAFAATRPAVPTALKGESGLERAGRRWSMRNILVVVQICACMVLLCLTGLYLHSLAELANVNSGFRTDGLRMLAVDPLHNGYTADEVPLVLKRIGEQVRAMPGVVSASWTDAVPLTLGVQTQLFHISGKGEDSRRDPNAAVFAVEPGYLETMGIERVAGKDLNGAGANAPRQIVVNELFARRMFPKGNAIGEHVSPNWQTGTPKSYEIVGIVKNTKVRMMSETDMPTVYKELDQALDSPRSLLLGYSLMVRYRGNGAEVATALRNVVHGVDPSLAVFGEKEMSEQVTDAMLIPRAESTIFGTFGLMGLILAAVGLYGVMSYSVQRRTQEIGIRLALGATRTGVQGLIVRQGMMLSAVALGIGLPVALGASKIAAKLQYGIAAYDPVSFTGMPLFLILVALVACWVPARRAARVNPQVALRHE